MPITKDQIDAIKKECEAVLELGGGEVLATLPAHDVLELADSHALLKERVEELECVIQRFDDGFVEAVDQFQRWQPIKVLEIARAALSKQQENE